MEQVQITFSGKDLNAVAVQASNFISLYNSKAVVGEPAIAATTPKKTKKAAAPVAEETEDMLLDSSDETIETVEDDFLADVEETPAPKKAAKAPKLTDKDVNAAAMAHAKKHGRPKTLEILSKKFKVKSILELKPETYAQVIEALKV